MSRRPKRSSRRVASGPLPVPSWMTRVLTARLRKRAGVMADGHHSRTAQFWLCLPMNRGGYGRAMLFHQARHRVLGGCKVSWESTRPTQVRTTRRRRGRYSPASAASWTTAGEPLQLACGDFPWRRNKRSGRPVRIDAAPASPHEVPSDRPVSSRGRLIHGASISRRLAPTLAASTATPPEPVAHADFVGVQRGH